MKKLRDLRKGKDVRSMWRRGAVLMRGVTFSCGFSWSLAVQSILVDHLIKGPAQSQLLKVVVQVLTNLNAFPHVNSGLVLSPEGSL